MHSPVLHAPAVPCSASSCSTSAVTPPAPPALSDSPLEPVTACLELLEHNVPAAAFPFLRARGHGGMGALFPCWLHGAVPAWGTVSGPTVLPQ